jgi:hypothetical protein
LGCFDFILGVDYLRTLGPILWDFEAMTLSFSREDCRVLWQGVRSPSVAAPQQQLAALSADAQQPLLDVLLQQHGAIFDEPTGLPLARPYDNRIHLLPGTAPVVVRPYHYPQLQKDELERQCAAMLAQGIIRLSTSPFSTPVLLARKGDKSWRFCIDYRSLNAKTSKDKFPIPWWTSCWTSCMVLDSSPSSICVRAITRCGCTPTTSTRLPSTRTMAIMSFW